MSPITTVGASPTPYIEELVVGFENAEYGKETPSQKIAYRCPSFVNNGDKLIVDVYVGDSSYKYHQEFGGEPSYDTYGQNGYPNLQVYSCDLLYIRTVQFNNKALINGRLNKYLRIFTKDEMSFLELARDEDVSHGKHETVEIDFSNYEADSYGRIAFSFSWDSGEQPVEGTDWKGRRQSISKATKVKLGSTLSRYVVAAKVYAPTVNNDAVTYTWDKQGGSTSSPTTGPYYSNAIANYVVK